MKATAPCPCCGYEATASTFQAAVPLRASEACYSAYLDLTAYNLNRGRIDFLHQEAVDAYAAQHPGPPAKPIRLWFALIGLHLAIDLHRTGREVQQAHQRLALQRRTWQMVVAPHDLTGATAGSVLAVPVPDERDRALLVWAGEVWQKWRHIHADVAALVSEAGL